MMEYYLALRQAAKMESEKEAQQEEQVLKKQLLQEPSKVILALPRAGKMGSGPNSQKDLYSLVAAEEHRWDTESCRSECIQLLDRSSRTRHCIGWCDSECSLMK